eukprot:TRINITY_DN7103_c0_g1_i7.p1 TRINITY_DN7103_c0_g1~~TRINITY_DN7103_c0_g1_i7.p1  ORF type:complete len:141 (+),score=7.60 TRINITY_DN7103_c0_g1_i7:583-1005(+)
MNTTVTRARSLDAPARTGIIRIRRGWHHAGVTQLVEYHVANVVVVGSSPITRFLSPRRAGSPSLKKSCSDALPVLMRRQGGTEVLDRAKRSKSMEPTADQTQRLLAITSEDLIVTEAETAEIGRAVQQECRDRSRMPSSA